MAGIFELAWKSLSESSKKLKILATLKEKRWVQVSEGPDKVTLIFQPQNTLIRSINGQVDRGRWEYIDEESLTITLNHAEYLISIRFFLDEHILVAKFDGAISQQVFADELKVKKSINRYLNELERLKKNNLIGYLAQEKTSTHAPKKEPPIYIPVNELSTHVPKEETPISIQIDEPSQPTKVIPKINFFNSDTYQLSDGDVFTLSWKTTHASQIEISPKVGFVQSSGSKSLKVKFNSKGKSELKLIIYNNEGEKVDSKSIDLFKMPEKNPKIQSFTASKYSLQEGEEFQISWSTIEANRIEILPKIGAVEADGAKTLKVHFNSNPSRILTLTVYNKQGDAVEKSSIKIVKLNK